MYQSVNPFADTRNPSNQFISGQQMWGGGFTPSGKLSKEKHRRYLDTLHKICIYSS